MADMEKIFYHGTLEEFEEGIRRSDGVRGSEGVGGYYGVSLSNDPATAMMWSQRAHEFSELREQEHNPLILQVTVPPDHLKYITPDFNQIGEGCYTFDRDWRHPCVRDVIYNKCKRGDRVWEKWYAEYGQQVPYEVDRGLDKVSGECEVQIPVEWLRECVDPNCKETTSLLYGEI